MDNWNIKNSSKQKILKSIKRSREKQIETIQRWNDFKLVLDKNEYDTCEEEK